ncbi:MAG UNVERIFIED_CONTAM: LacI family DNA-binding transcriptional regulator [Anaerolineae bacterium]
MNKSRVTSRDVARHAGVSQTTVSFVLNNVSKANISDDTIRRVWHATQSVGVCAG